MSTTRRRFLAAAALMIASVAALLGSFMSASAHDGRVAAQAAESRAARAHPFVYVAIGASDSYGIGADDPGTESWPAVLARRLPAGTHFVDLGVPGILLHRAGEVELPVALDAHPDLVTVWLAVNDLAAGVPLSSYSRDLGVLLGALRRGTRARILVANVPNLTLLPSFAGRADLAATIEGWNAAIAAQVHGHGATLVDLYAHWQELAQHPEYVGPDGLHPTTAGYRRLAEVFWHTYVAAERVR